MFTIYVHLSTDTDQPQKDQKTCRKEDLSSNMKFTQKNFTWPCLWLNLWLLLVFLFCLVILSWLTFAHAVLNKKWVQKPQTNNFIRGEWEDFRKYSLWQQLCIVSPYVTEKKKSQRKCELCHQEPFCCQEMF